MQLTSPIAASALVALGGGAGAVLRYQFGRAVSHTLGPGLAASFPWATLGVNLIGSVAMGLLAGVLARLGDSESMRLLLGVGLLGGFTTFSAFSLDIVLLVERGAWSAAVLYAGVSVVGGAAALFCTLAAMRA